MALNILFIRNDARLGKARRATLHGREYLVAPMTMIVGDSVLNGSQGPLLYPTEETGKDPDAWNGMPLVLGHPMDEEGNNVSARSPGVLEAVGLGHVFNSIFPDGNLSSEAWFDVELTKQRDADLPSQQQLIPRLNRGDPIEISTGLFTENFPVPKGSTHNGVAYDAIARNYRPDHVAILVDEKGACSIEDGCGVYNAENCGGKGGKPGPCPSSAEVLASINSLPDLDESPVAQGDTQEDTEGLAEFPLPADTHNRHDYGQRDQTPEGTEILSRSGDDFATTTRKSLEIDSLTGTQNFVYRNQLTQMQKGKAEVDGLRPLVVKDGEDNYIMDGHHKVALAKLQGAGSIEVDFITVESLRASGVYNAEGTGLSDVTLEEIADLLSNSLVCNRCGPVCNCNNSISEGDITMAYDRKKALTLLGNCKAWKGQEKLLNTFDDPLLQHLLGNEASAAKLVIITNKAKKALNEGEEEAAPGVPYSELGQLLGVSTDPATDPVAFTSELKGILADVMTKLEGTTPPPAEAPVEEGVVMEEGAELTEEEKKLKAEEEAAMAAASKNKTATGNRKTPVAKAITEVDYLKNAPPRIQAVLANALKKDKAERVKMATKLVSHLKGDKRTAVFNKLVKLTTEELQERLDLIPAANRGHQDDGDDIDQLVENWSGAAGGNDLLDQLDSDSDLDAITGNSGGGHSEDDNRPLIPFNPGWGKQATG